MTPFIDTMLKVASWRARITAFNVHLVLGCMHLRVPQVGLSGRILTQFGVPGFDLRGQPSSWHQHVDCKQSASVDNNFRVVKKITALRPASLDSNDMRTTPIKTDWLQVRLLYNVCDLLEVLNWYLTCSELIALLLIIPIIHNFGNASELTAWACWASSS